MLGMGAIGGIGVTAGVIGAYYYVQPGLPAAETIRDIPLQIPLRIFSRDGYLISEIGERRRILVTYDELPQHVVDAFVAAEDQRFFVHPGIDYRGIVRAFVRFATTGELRGRGGSTLTQQLARDYFLTREQKFTRKIREAFLAYKIEQEFTKEQIMALFLNKMFFGQRAYGVAAAAQVYFNKDLADINAAEAATLAGVLPAPSRYNPVYSAANAEMRRGYVLGRMRDLGYIDEQTMTRRWPGQWSHDFTARPSSSTRRSLRRWSAARCSSAMAKARTQTATRSSPRSIPACRQAANYSLRNGLLEFTRRRGYYGPIQNVELTDEILARRFTEWPIEIRELLEQYAPGGLSVALVTAVNDNNTASILFRGGVTATLPWVASSGPSRLSTARPADRNQKPHGRARRRRPYLCHAYYEGYLGTCAGTREHRVLSFRSTRLTAPSPR